MLTNQPCMRRKAAARKRCSAEKSAVYEHMIVLDQTGLWYLAGWGVAGIAIHNFINTSERVGTRAFTAS